MEGHHNSKERLQQILKKYVNGTATEEEIKFLDQYDRYIDQNSNAFAELTPDERTYIESNLRERITKELKEKPIKRISWAKYAAAAVLFFFSIATATYIVIHKKKEEQTLSSQYGQDALPGSNKATVTLSDGSRYELNSNQSGITIGEDGIAYTNGELITATDKIVTAVIEVPRGGMYDITLQDGSKVSLNSASTLRYPVQFLGSERKVELKGEGYFDVARNPDQPFIVTTNGQELKVLGTSFNIRNYDAKVLTTLIEGSIALTNQKSNERVTLSPGQQATISDKDTRIVKVDPSEFIAWKDGYILIKDADIHQVCKELERWYDVRFKFQEGFKSNDQAFLSFDRNVVLSTVLLSLEKTYGVQFSINGKEVRINQKK